MITQSNCAWTNEKATSTEHRPIPADLIVHGVGGMVASDFLAKGHRPNAGNGEENKAWPPDTASTYGEILAKQGLAWRQAPI